MNCKEFMIHIYRYMDGDCEGVPTQEIEVHIKICRDCKGRLTFEKTLKERCRKVCSQEPLPEKLRQRIAKLLDL